jgi:hypothetical protein
MLYVPVIPRQLKCNISQPLQPWPNIFLAVTVISVISFFLIDGRPRCTLLEQEVE